PQTTIAGNLSDQLTPILQTTCIHPCSGQLLAGQLEESLGVISGRHTHGPAAGLEIPIREEVRAPGSEAGAQGGKGRGPSAGAKNQKTIFCRLRHFFSSNCLADRILPAQTLLWQFT